MVATAGALIRVPVKQIKVQSQIRKTFNAETITELAASIDSLGLLQPITVRAGHRGPKLRYVLVFGERRLKAVQSLGWEHLDVILREFSDLEIAEIGKKQLIENLQREDLDPLEEGAAYATMTGGVDTIDDVAAKVGRTVPYVYRRLRLNDLVPKLKAALANGKLPLLAAEELARQEESVQMLYLKTNHGFFGGVDEIRGFLRHSVRNDLAHAPFDMTDAELVPSASPCAQCPKRTGFAPNLFADDEGFGTDLCQDPQCYGAKTVAHLNARIAVEKPELLIALDYNRPIWLQKLKLKQDIVGYSEWTATKKDAGQKAMVVCASNQKLVGTVRWVKKGRQQYTHEQTPAERLRNRVLKWEQRVTAEVRTREAKLVASKVKKVGRREAEFLVWSMWDESHYETRKTVLAMLELDLPTKQQHGTTFHDEDTPLRKYIAAVKTIPALLTLAVVIATAPCAGESEFYGAHDREKKYREIQKAMKIDRTKLRAAVVKDIPRPTKPKATTKTTKRKARR